MEEERIVLIKFFSEMNMWEKYCESIVNENGLTWEQKTVLMKEKVSDIFTKYCTPKDRKMGRPNVLSWGCNGSYIYDPEKEKIKEVKKEKKQTIIYTYTTEGEEQRCYTFLKVGNVWLIDGKKRRWEHEKRWENVYL
jgi:hypothetical protein